MQTKKSRLSRNLERQSKKQLALFLIGIIAIIALIINFGVYGIEGLGYLASKISTNTTEPVRNAPQVQALIPPSLSQVPEGTQEQTISLSGKTYTDGGNVELHVNGNRVKVTEVTGSEFTFKTVKLNEGDNEIRVRHRLQDNYSDFSKAYYITYAKDPPKLEVSFPSDGATLGKGDQQINVHGKTDPQNQVTVNSLWATVDGDGNFSYYLQLQDGENTIKIEAENPAGSKTTKEMKVTFRP